MKTAMKLMVGIADMKITGNPAAMVIAYVGPCIGVAIYDPVVGVSGILHFMLPDEICLTKGEEKQDGI
jgi:chemotaxis protein CheD